MEGIDFTGLGAVLVGVAAVIGAGASAYMAVKNTKKIRDIDHAVNGRPRGAQTMQSQVDDIHSTQPPPLAITEEINGEALLQLVRELVAAERERRRKEEP